MKKVKTMLTRISRTFKLKTGQTQNNSTNGKPVFMTLEEARKDPALVKEMSEQLNEVSIITGTQTEYVADVRYRGHQYYISGKHIEWIRFYGMDGSVEYKDGKTVGL